MSKDDLARPDSMLIEPNHIVSAREAISEQGSPGSLADLEKREPALASYIDQSMTAIAGRLALAGAPTPFIQEVHQEMFNLLLSSLEAQRRGHYDLWKGTIVGTRLEKMMQDRPAKGRRRRKGPEGE